MPAVTLASDRSWLRAVRYRTAPWSRTVVDPAPPSLLCRLLTRHPTVDPAPVRPVVFRVAGEWAANTDDLRFPGVRACTAVGVEVTDPAGHPLWAVLLEEAQPVPAGAGVLVPAGALVLAAADYAAVRDAGAGGGQ